MVVVVVVVVIVAAVTYPLRELTLPRSSYSSFSYSSIVCHHPYYHHYTDIYDVLSSGGLESVIQKTYSLSQAPLAHQDVIEHKDGSGGKLVLLPTQLE